MSASTCRLITRPLTYDTRPFSLRAMDNRTRRTRQRTESDVVVTKRTIVDPRLVCIRCYRECGKRVLCDKCRRKENRNV